MLCPKKRRNVMVVSLIIILSFTLYQLYIFRRITNLPFKTDNVVPVIDNDGVRAHVHSVEDVNINHGGAIKGVLLYYMVHYRPNANNEFKCLNSSQLISFDLVNDEYCDCSDGSDEPSTAACTNGIFHCDTQGRSSEGVTSIPSNKVNDGICDCCDGSDEWIFEPGKKLLSQPNKRHYSFYVNKCPYICS